MHGGKAVCTTVFGKPPISAFPIFSTDSLFIFSAIFIISVGNLGSSSTSNLFPICLRISSLSNLAVSFLVR